MTLQRKGAMPSSWDGQLIGSDSVRSLTLLQTTALRMYSLPALHVGGMRSWMLGVWMR